MAQRNYKSFAYLGFSIQYMERHLSILDTVVVTNFIIDSFPPPVICAQVRQVPANDDSNNKPLRTADIVLLVVRIGNCVVQFVFIVCIMLAAPGILGCDFGDLFVNLIWLRSREVEIEDR